MIVRTGHYHYTGFDRLDVTRKGNDPVGIALAPSWDLAWPLLEKRKRGTETDEDWKLYKAGYKTEMLASLDAKPAAWDTILASPEVTLVCFCDDATRCHRSLASMFLGAVAKWREVPFKLLGETDPKRPHARMLVVAEGSEASEGWSSAVENIVSSHGPWSSILTTGGQGPGTRSTERIAELQGIALAGYEIEGTRYHWHRDLSMFASRPRYWKGWFEKVERAVFHEIATAIRLEIEVHVLTLGASQESLGSQASFVGAIVHRDVWA